MLYKVETFSWGDGSVIKVIYDGHKDGVITIVSTLNKEIDRSILLDVVTIPKKEEEKIVTKTLELTQEGLREVFRCSDIKHGPSLDFKTKDNETFNVKK